MDPKLEFKLAPLLIEAARFLDYYKFNIDNIDKMVYDMHLRYPKEYTKEERRQLLTYLIDDPAQTCSINSYIHLEQYKYSVNERARNEIYDSMSEEKVSKQMELVNHNLEESIKIWFYRLHPKYTLQRITEVHDEVFDEINKKELTKIDYFSQLLFRNKAKQSLRLYYFNVADHLHDMVVHLYSKLFDDFVGNITPSLCRMILLSEHKMGDQNSEVASNLVMQHGMPFNDEILYRVYSYVKRRNLYNKLYPNDASPEEVVQELFSKYHASCAILNIRDRVARFFQEKVNCSINEEARKKAEAYQADNISEPADNDQNETFGSSTANLSGNLNESIDLTKDEDNTGVEPAPVPHFGHQLLAPPSDKMMIGCPTQGMMLPSSLTESAQRLTGYSPSKVTPPTRTLISTMMNVSPPKLSFYPRYLPLNSMSPAISMHPTKGLPAAASTSTSTIINKSPTTTSLPPSEMLPFTSSPLSRRVIQAKPGSARTTLKTNVSQNENTSNDEDDEPELGKPAKKLTKIVKTTLKE